MIKYLVNLKLYKMKNYFILWICVIVLSSCSVTHKIVDEQEPILTYKPIHIDTIPFEVTANNNIKFEVVLNGKDSVALFFDTGSTDLNLLIDAIEEKTTLLDNETEDFILENYTPLNQPISLKLGSMTIDSLKLYPIPEGPRDMAGHFGWDLLKDKVVELDYDKNLMIVHSNTIAIPTGYSKIDIEYVKTVFCVQGDVIMDGTTFTSRYLFDTGFQRSIILSKDLRAKESFPNNLEVIKESKLTNSEGEIFVNEVVLIDQFYLGETYLNEIPIQLFNTPSPISFETHYLGNELLKRFNTILDFKNDVIYLKPNSLQNLPYGDAS